MAAMHFRRLMLITTASANPIQPITSMTMQSTTTTLERDRASATRNDAPAGQEFWFPGRWIGGVSLVLGPLLLLAGVLLRLQFDFFFPQQLAAFQDHPELVFAAYSAFAAGNVLLWPAIATLARQIGRKKPGLALWGGALAMFGLFARTFHAGVDHLAFQMVRVQGIEVATKTIADTYGAYHIFHALSPAIFAGWIVLAIGAYRSGTLGVIRSVSLALMASLMMGVLKGSSPTSVVATAGLCVALVPLDIQVLRDGPMPRPRVLFGWCLLMIGLVVLFYFLGELG